MAIIASRFIFVAIVLLSTVSAFAGANDLYPSKPDSDLDTLPSGFAWELLPGEDILYIARSMFPNDKLTREKLIRAIIRSNPEHFPDGRYRALTPGIVIHLPDLRTLDAYARPTVGTKRAGPEIKQQPAIRKPQQPQSTPKSEFNNDTLEYKLLVQLEKKIESESQEIDRLNHHLEALALQIATLQSQLAAKPIPIIPQQNDEVQSAKPQLQDIVTSQPPEPANSATDQTLEPEPEPEPEPKPVPTPAEPVQPASFSMIDLDTLTTPVGILVILILVLILRRHRRARLQATESSMTAISPELTERLNGDPSFSQTRNRTTVQKQSSIDAELAHETVAINAKLMLEQGEAEATIDFLQKQLVINPLDVPGWLLLFELLYHSGNKADFKKNARRFKRLGQYPDIWIQIQKLGHRLEPIEPLYFSARIRQEKFFSDVAVPE